jgi:acetyltransferase-like isoleucine patch superfamily enzyme
VTARTLPWDWYPGTLPDGVEVDDTAYVETSFSFLLYRSEQRPGVVYGRGASSYLGTMFDVGPRGRVHLGDFALVHGARIICDAEVVIGDHALISWNVVLMDTYRLSTDPLARRRELAAVAAGNPRVLAGAAEARPVAVGSGAWLGFDVVVLPGVTVGEGAIVGAKSVVTDDVPPYTVAAGNPARVVRAIGREDEHAVHAR